MNTEYLKYLLVVADSKSLNEAAQKCYITRQSLNAAISSLEKELNLKILNRSYTGVSLTEDGEVVLAVARNILESICFLQTLHNQENAAVADFDHLNLYVPPVMNFYFSQQIHTVLSQNNIYANVQTLDTDYGLQFLEEQSKIEGVYFLNIFDESKLAAFIHNDDYICKKLMTDYLVIVLAKKHELAKYKTISIQTLQKYPLASLQSGYQKECPFHYIFPDNEVLEISMRTDNILMFINAVEKGISISPISSFAYKHCEMLSQNAAITSVKLRPSVAFEFYCLYTKDYYLKHIAGIDLMHTILNDLIIH